MSVTTTATRAVVRTETTLFLREPGALFWIILFPTILLCVLGAVPGFRVPSTDFGGLRVIDIYLPVTLLVSMLFAGISTMPPVIAAYREGGILRRLGTTPVGPGSVLLAQVVLHAGAVIIASVLATAVGLIVFGVQLPASPIGYLIGFGLALVATFSIGAVIAALAPSARAATPLTMIVLFPAMFTAGVWLPVGQMPGVLRTIVGFTPLGASAEALTAASSGSFPGLTQLIVVAAWAVVASVVALRTFRWQ